MKVHVLGTGRSVPAHCLQSAEIDCPAHMKDRIDVVGVRQRYVCRSETQIDLAEAACAKALTDAGLKAEEIDVVISAASVPYQLIPSTAPLVMRALGISDGTAAAFDVNSTCLSFVSALEVAARMIEGGAVRHVLVVSSEIASRGLPWTTAPDVAALFGDGAAAAVLGAAPETSASEIKAVRLRSYPAAYDACGICAGGTRFDFETDYQGFKAHSKFSMEGKALFRLTSQYFSGFVEDLLTQAGWDQSDVDLVVPHQASPAGLEHMIRHTGFDRNRVMRIVEDYGNQVAASIPFTFDVARERGLAPAGTRVLMLGTSAGVSFGGAALVI
ncbi:3-oxoacyl-ACP synthase III family protein [Palleronia caenipelagi]|uniref:Ketoacyl-ACP synthase III n=1 Tax=Palleronia caenipelagi TaxID=2489174 RepID=A0A547PNU0_9RHOB|nr:ketoacyl-ACP synthase III [Palleronia caenipelagi]TRD15791.1 ketoacyl-ACP synthase III [Palleronia caenipelagi]